MDRLDEQLAVGLDGVARQFLERHPRGRIGRYAKEHRGRRVQVIDAAVQIDGHHGARHRLERRPGARARGGRRAERGHVLGRQHFHAHDQQRALALMINRPGAELQTRMLPLETEQVDFIA